jgi:hypothetical protein
MVSPQKVIIGYPSDKSRFDTVIQLWKRLPLPITKMLGPVIRKNISL